MSIFLKGFSSSFSNLSKVPCAVNSDSILYKITFGYFVGWNNSKLSTFKVGIVLNLTIVFRRSYVISALTVYKTKIPINSKTTQGRLPL